MKSSPITTRRGAQKAKIQTRGMVKVQREAAAIASNNNNCNIRKPNPALIEAKKKAREKISSKPSLESVSLVKDFYQIAMSSIKMIRSETGLIYDVRMAQHKCLWEPNYPECPERFTRIIDRCRELNLMDRCKTLQPRDATIKEILTKHTQEHFDLLKSTSQCEDAEKLEELSSHYDAIYIHPTTFDLSVLAVGSTVELIDNILQNKVQNGMAVIRPPGHHALKSEFNGYCYFNNIAIAAQHALDKCGLKRILVVDWDIHHGQSSQRAFYDDPRVLYFSIHRYEHGLFWPNLRESDFDCIGEGEGIGYNFNVPLNKIGMTNADYLAIWQQILLPVAMEYQPELVIVSAGYDAAYGCFEGEMELTPAFYSHLLSPLLSLAEGKVAVVLEGGYCLQSLSEGAALTLKTLLGDPCPILVEKLDAPCDSIQESILNCIHSHRPYWNCLQINDTYTLEEYNNINPQPDLHKVVQSYRWTEPTPDRFPTRSCFPIQSDALKREISERLGHLQIATNLNVPSIRCCYVYDELMMQHENLLEEHPERPARIKEIENRFKEFGLFDRLHKVQSREATTTEICMAHTRQHVNLVRKSTDLVDLQELSQQFTSIYFHPKTFQCASLAAGSVLQVVDSVLNGKSRSGVCIVRPPGHHAESDVAHGFCLFNNVAIAANHALKNHGLKRVLIVDWDVHHGNGTQHMFESNPNVLYVSVHRYDYATFFPKSEDANYTVVGDGKGEGFNVNIPWNKKGMGDAEYINVFQRIILPIAYEFDPELVLVSAGFDAAVGDPLGLCKVSPEAYGYFTHWLSALANGRVVVCLEGGYNVNSISYAMTMCAKALLGDPLPMLQVSHKINSSCIETVQNVLRVQQKYWRSLRFNLKLPAFENIEKSSPSSADEMTKIFSNIKLSSTAVVDADDNAGKPSSSSAAGSSSSAPLAGSSKQTSDSKKTTLADYLSENLQALENEEMFAVYPLNNCPHLNLLKPEQVNSINTKATCFNCETPKENWLCLHCEKVCCGRFVNEHMLQHHIDTDHPLTLSFADLSVWCYKCENYIDNAALYKYKNLAHQDKFGEELVWSYGDSIQLQNI